MDVYRQGEEMVLFVISVSSSIPLIVLQETLCVVPA